MKVALDLEDVIVESNRVFLERLQSFVDNHHPESDTSFVKEDIKGWRFDGLRQELAEIRGWDNDVTQKFFHGDSNDWDGFYSITQKIWENEPEAIEPVTEDLKKQVTDLRKVVEESDGELHIVTARQNVRIYIERRIKQLGLEHLLDGLEIKVSKDELDFDIYIDDYPHLHQKLDDGIQIMVDQPWNQNQSLETPHERVSGVSQAVEVIGNLGR